MSAKHGLTGRVVDPGGQARASGEGPGGPRTSPRTRPSCSRRPGSRAGPSPPRSTPSSWSCWPSGSSAARKGPPQIDTRLAGSEFGVPEELNTLGGIDTPITIPEPPALRRLPRQGVHQPQVGRPGGTMNPAAGFAGRGRQEPRLPGLGDGFGSAKFGQGGEGDPRRRGQGRRPPVHPPLGQQGRPRPPRRRARRQGDLLARHQEGQPQRRARRRQPRRLRPREHLLAQGEGRRQQGQGPRPRPRGRISLVGPLLPGLRRRPASRPAGRSASSTTARSTSSRAGSPSRTPGARNTTSRSTRARAGTVRTK